MKIKRNTLHPMDGGANSLPYGTFEDGITNSEVAFAFAQVLSYWPLVEAQVIRLFSNLVGITNEFDGRILFFTFHSNRARIDIMKALLEESPRNKTKGPEYDLAIQEFRALNGIRNGFVHGIWRTHKKDDKDNPIDEVWVAEASTDNIYFMTARKVTKKELDDLLRRMLAFEEMVRKLRA